MGIIANTIYQIDAEEMEKFRSMDEKKVIDAFCNKWSNTLVTPKEVALFHNISEATVINYCKDGLLIPEHREKDYCAYRFRLSEVMKLDISNIKGKPKVRNSNS